MSYEVPTDNFKERLSQIQHDMRTSVGHIMGYVKMLEGNLDQDLSPEFLRDLVVIKTSGERMVTLIDEFLGPNKQSFQELELSETQFQLRLQLNHINCYTEMLRETALNDDQEHLLTVVDNIALGEQRMLKLIATILVPSAFEVSDPEEPSSKTVDEVAPEELISTSDENNVITETNWLGKGGKILVVDDDGANRNLLQRRLGRYGYEAVTVESGEEALTSLNTAQFDLILLDLTMPGLSGLETLEQLKCDKRLRAIPVIMLTGADTLDSIVHCVLKGADDYILKPFNPVLLLARIGACLEKIRLRQQKTLSAQDRQTTLSAQGWLTRVLQEEQRGEFLSAYDVAQQGLAQHPGDLQLGHRSVLVLARSGATRQAQALFDNLQLKGFLNDEIAALEPRLAKDRAFAVDGDQRMLWMRAAADKYELIFERTKNYYTGINAATLWLLSGVEDKAKQLAQTVLDPLLNDTEMVKSDAYYKAATMAEAYLVLNDVNQCRTYLKLAATLHGQDFAAVATTRKQLRRICLYKGIEKSILGALKLPTVIFYSGPMISRPEKAGPFPPRSTQAIKNRIQTFFRTQSIGYGYGSLACGSNILVAETLLSTGAELHVVLPFEKEEFKQTFVAPGGPAWLGRFDDCLRKATSVSFATEDRFRGDTELLHYSSRLAMGLALLRSTYLDTEVEQLAVWDGITKENTVETAKDVSVWQSHNLPIHVIGSQPTPGAGETKKWKSRSKPSRHQRTIKTFLFGDFRGFSKLRDDQLPAFVDGVLGGVSSILQGYSKEIEKYNTWGDGLFVVMKGVKQAANCALDLQEMMAKFDHLQFELPSDLSLRLSGHVGPVFELLDPVLKDLNYFGGHVALAARMEPVTPVGEVYVTKFFASELALGNDPALGCEYVGHLPVAKDYGSFAMYVLKRRML